MAFAEGSTPVDLLGLDEVIPEGWTFGTIVSPNSGVTPSLETGYVHFDFSGLPVDAALPTLIYTVT